jgi:hypothetical protein
MCLLLALWPATGQATQIERRTPRQLGEQAEVVVRGHVESSESFWNEKHTKVFTRTRIVVDETYKGDPGPAVDVIQLGGVIDNLRVTVHGAPQWRVGQEVLLFAEPYDEIDYRVSGFCQGKFRVMRDELTGEAYIQTPPAGGVEVLGAPATGGRAAAPDHWGTPLDEFVGRALGTFESGEVPR